MPVLKFETKVVDGKPNIVYDTEKLGKGNKRKDYKLKNQKYPLRNNEVTESNKQSNYSHQNGPESESYMKKKANNVHNKEDIKNGRNSIISTPDQNSQFKATSNKNLKLTKPFKDKENLFNLLDQNPQIKKKDTKSKDNQDEMYEKQRSKSGSLTESDIDEIMKQVVLENKNLLTEEQLVDVLAKLYLDAKISQKKKVVESQEQSESHSKNDHLKLSNGKDQSKQDEISKLKSNHSEKPPDTSHVTKTLNPVAPLTAVQKKQLQWEKERREMAEIASYNPWGKPGCGAPTKSPIDGVFKNDNHITQKDQLDSARYMKSDYHTSGNFRSLNQDISQAELKRQQWIMELNEQVAEKERRKWIDNNPVKSHSDVTDMRDTKNVEPDLNGHCRGKGLADLNQMSTEEIMQKRLKQMEQQEAIRKQIEEKELQKRLDREHKAKLDQQEDARLFREKQQLDTQFLSETARIRQRDDESGKRLAQQRAQLEAAERSALLDKKLKRLQKLEMAGHDTRQLRAGLLADQIPGNRDETLDLKGDSNTFSKHTFEKFPESWSALNSPSLYGRMGFTEDQGVQTENNINKPYQYRPMDDFHTHENHHVNYKDETRRPQKHNKSANDNVNEKLMKHNSTNKRPLSASSVKHKLSHKIRKPEPIESRKPWGVKKQSKKYVPQSKRDPFYFTSQESRENHKQERVNHIIAQVKANQDRIPDREVHDGRSSQRHKRCDTQRRYDNDKENYEINHDTYDLKSNSRIVLDNEDRVQASVRYKDTYKQPMKTNQTYREEPESNKPIRPTESISNWWSDPSHEIVRTTDVLDPAMADLKLPISRENTGREKARQGYYKNLNPAQFGEPLETQPANHNTYFIRDGDKRDTFYQPEGHPTQRQNTILKQLSDFREGLLLKQKEIETSLSMNADL